MNYRSKSRDVTAMQWTGHNYAEIAVFLAETVTVSQHSEIVLDTAWGDYIAPPYYWIVKSETGAVTAMNPDAFTAMYEEIEYAEG